MPFVCLYVQWLCNADKSSHDPRLRLKCVLEDFLCAVFLGLSATSFVTSIWEFAGLSLVRCIDA